MDESLNPFRSPQPEQAEAYVRAEVFRGATVTGFVDRYEFFVPEITQVVPQAIAFYEGTKAKVVSEDPLTFRRGNLWSTVLGPESYAQQRIVLRVDPQQHRVNLEYHIQLLLTARVYNTSHREAVRLALHLGAVHPDALGI
ncbi:hypothetical protein [Bremerella cremea]|uniref:hypothetical protein n=1 Tax=Bremerella cremea TaxID=1031537 RepID=UPI0031EE71E5